MALSNSSWPPLPKPTLFFLLSPITANDSLTKMTVNTEAMMEVMNNICTLSKKFNNSGFSRHGLDVFYHPSISVRKSGLAELRQ